MTKTDRRARGDDAEQRAREHLEAAGLATRAANWSCRLGEIDLIMVDGETLVFVEGRYRSGSGFGGALGSIDQRKRRRLIRAASVWLQRQRLGDRPARFDVVTLGPDGHIDWRADAFSTD